MVTIDTTTDSSLLAILNEEIQTLHHSLYPYRFKAYNQTDIAGAFNAMLENPNCSAYIAMHGENVAGYLCLTVKEHTGNAFQIPYRSLYIDQIAVLRPYRHSGIGKYLLDKAYDIAQANGISRLELDHWTMNNLAREFFNHQGFRYFNERMFKVLL